MIAKVPIASLHSQYAPGLRRLIEPRWRLAPILETSLQRAREWLHDIERELGFGSEHDSYAALRATLHAVRDRLPVESSRISAPGCRR